MGLITIAELIDILRKNFIRILAFSLAVGILTMIGVDSMQTYTCTLNYKYDYSAAEEGFAPDGDSALNPYEIQEPLVIRGALNSIGLGESRAINVEKVRNNIYISEVVPDIDKEVSESAALLGEKYDVKPTEFQIKYTYDASWGDEFGAKFFDSLIRSYDDFLLTHYYNKKEIPDFAKILDPEKEDYLAMADVMDVNIESIINYLDELAGYYPNYRSKRTGYSFAELANLYKSLRNIQYAKYYGNIRSGNLSKDAEMVIKNYRSKVEEMEVELAVAKDISKGYRSEITSFYDSYKKAGLYLQAEQTQTTLDTSNNRDQDILHDYDLELLTNTYDGVVLKYTEYAEDASILERDIEHYNSIITAFEEDSVSSSTKARLLEKNEGVFEEICTLSKEFSILANETISEHFDTQVNEDLLYLIVTDVQADKPVMVLVVFAGVLSFGLFFIFLVVKKMLEKFTMASKADEAKDESGIVAEEEMNELQRLFYRQYKQNFPECFIVYQPMINCKSGEETNYEAFIRWNSEEYGAVSAMKTIECAMELNLLQPFNSWIMDKICENLAQRKKDGKKIPVIHVNFPGFAVEDFGIADIIVKSISDYDVDPGKICVEIESPSVINSMDDVALLQKIGVKICVDKFESSKEQDEILEALIPEYIKFSADVVNNDMLATSEEEVIRANTEMLKFIFKTLARCEKNHIKACICGIENKEQESMFVKEMNFDYKQGYLYGKPAIYKK